jgi:hypothetical protein
MNARIQLDAVRLGGGAVTYLEREAGTQPSSAPAGAGANNRAWEYWKRRVAAEVERR